MCSLPLINVVLSSWKQKHTEYIVFNAVFTSIINLHPPKFYKSHQMSQERLTLGNIPASFHLPPNVIPRGLGKSYLTGGV